MVSERRAHLHLRADNYHPADHMTDCDTLIIHVEEERDQIQKKQLLDNVSNFTDSLISSRLCFHFMSVKINFLKLF